MLELFWSRDRFFRLPIPAAAVVTGTLTNAGTIDAISIPSGSIPKRKPAKPDHELRLDELLLGIGGSYGDGKY